MEADAEGPGACDAHRGGHVQGSMLDPLRRKACRKAHRLVKDSLEGWPCFGGPWPEHIASKELNSKRRLAAMPAADPRAEDRSPMNIVDRGAAMGLLVINDHFLELT